SQWWGMGRGLIQRDSVAREIIEKCDQLFFRLSGWSLIERMLHAADRSSINETAVAQPAIFALQVALAARLAEWGIRPQAVVGHSIGEIAAASVAGALSLPQAVEVVYHRSRLQERSRLQGGMAALGLPAENARAYLAKFDGKIEVAAINGPELVTVAGPRRLITEFVAEVGRDREDVLCQLLRVDYAFHSSQMDPYTDELRDSLADLRPNTAHITMFSTMTGDAVSAQPLDAEYWCGNMRRPVLFKQAIDQAIDAEFDTFLELGPHPSLGAAVRACLANHDRSGSIGTLHRERDDIRSIASAAASLHVNGIPIDWNAIIDPGSKFVELSGYPFEKKDYWAEAEESRSARLKGPVHPLLGFRLGCSGHVWQGEIDAKNPRYLSDHRIDNTVVFPAAGYVELMLAAAREVFGAGSYELEAVTFHEALFLGAETSAFLETSLDETRGTVTIRSRERGIADWVMRATGRVRSWQFPELPISPWSPKIQPPPQVGRARFYRDLAREGHTFGPAFQGVETLWYADGCSLGKITFAPSVIDTAAYILHPAQLDCCLQVIRGLSEFGAGATLGTMAIPSRMGRIRVFRKPTVHPLFARAEGVEETSSEIVANINVFDGTGRLIALIEGFRCVRVARSDTRQQTNAAEFYRERWTALPALADVAPPHPQGCCVILADRGGLGGALANRMVECGRRVALVHRVGRTALLAQDCFETTGTLASLRRVFAMMSLPPSDVVVLWPVNDKRGSRTRPAQARAGVEDVLAVARALAGLATPP
ncbi:MAG TPA: acyltransferase domain-containing protein, partial [Sphingomicrobium sp.]|nr:acyltransferase domain-containing protein [Sphingomicrobium sp.]